jgi:hypothetical protein
MTSEFGLRGIAPYRLVLPNSENPNRLFETSDIRLFGDVNRNWVFGVRKLGRRIKHAARMLIAENRLKNKHAKKKVSFPKREIPNNASEKRSIREGLKI